MSKSFDKSNGRSSTDKKGTDNDSNYKIIMSNKNFLKTILRMVEGQVKLNLYLYLSNQTSIKRLGSTLRITNVWFISKMM